MKQIILFLTVLLLISGCSVTSYLGEEPDSSDSRGDGGPETESTGDTVTSTPKSTAQPRTGTKVLVDGQLVAVRPVLPLSFVVSGRLTEIFVQPGDFVQTGDIVASLDESTLAETVIQAEMQIAQAKTALAQTQLSLEELESWEADDLVVALAEANLAVAEANHVNALTQDSAAGNSLTSAAIAIDQATRSVADAQEAYDKAWDTARDWELGDPWRKQALEFEREATTRALQNAEEGLTIARANYNLTAAGLNNDNALNADAGIASAQQALDQAKTGPKQSDIALAQLQVEQANISLDQAEFGLEQARNALQDAKLVAPWAGTVLSVETAPGAIVGAGSPILTLLDAEDLQFYTSNLSERDLAEIEPGQVTQITLKSYPGQPISGEVVRIVPQAGGFIGDAATFTVVVNLDPTEIILYSGMTGRAEIQRDAANN